MELLKVENLCKTYGTGEARVEALKKVSFSMQRGEFAAVVGASGSGKSTLLNCIGGLDDADGGKVLLGGRDLFAMEETERTVFRRQNIGFIFQSFHLIPELNVEQNIIFPLLLDYKKPDRNRVDEMLEVLGLTGRRRHLPGQLSGGQQQRVAAARAMVTNPALVLADEPTGALDSRSSHMLLDMLEELNQNLSATILMVTHDSFTASYCRRILFIKDGKIFNEIHRGAKSRKEFFEEIMEVVSVLGGETNDRG